MKTNGYFKWAMLITSVFLVIISGSFAYTLVTNKRIDRLDDRILLVLQGQYRMSAKVDIILDYIDGKGNDRDGNNLYSEGPAPDNGNQFANNTRAFVRTCYLLLFDQEYEKKDKE